MKRAPADQLKPPYRVPLMDEIRALPWNGYTVATTFAGGGGSSTGYRLAGYRIVWANEIVPVARDSYAANKSPATVLDGRDIRKVQPSDILTATGLHVGELDLFDGSPPCVSFSTAGRREKHWGKVTQSHDIKQRHDDLFFEYVRLLDGLQPKTFVAENVSGLIKGTAKGYFLDILAALKACGYRVEAQLLDAQWLGVPQMRQRLIFVGVRNDLGLAPAFPSPLPYRYSVRDALPDLKARHLVVGDARLTNKPGNSFPRGQVKSLDEPCRGIQAGKHNLGGAAIHYLDEPATVRVLTNKSYREAWQSDALPSPTILAGGPGKSGCIGDDIGSGQTVKRRQFTIAEIKRICSFPDDYVLAGSYADQWARCGNAVPPVMMMHVAAAVRDRVLDRIPKAVTGATENA